VVDIAEIAEIPEPEESILDQMAQPDSITADQLFAEKFADNQEPVVIEIAEEIPSEETSAVSEVSAVEPESAIPEVSEERKKFYKDIHGKMDFVLSTLSKTRGVTSSFIMDKTGAILHIMSTENFDRMEMSQQALKGVEPLLEWRTSKEQTECELLYWVLEFKKGMMVLQPLTPEVFLVVLGKAGANFGAVRYSIEKNTGKLLSALAKMPA
jgi:predicted regulator of Ras-like GTPase activity (Roadblock/LC7/MglB family)